MGRPDSLSADGDVQCRSPPKDVVRKTFDAINDRSVDDISLEIFYKPHTISLLLACIFGLVYIAFTRSNEEQVQKEQLIS